MAGFLLCYAEDNWQELQSCIVDSADLVGRGYLSNSEWFEDNYSQLKPLINEKNDAYQKFL